jgi:hypothetical protein
MNRHDTRDGDGRYRPRTGAENHAASVAELIASKHAQHGTLLGRLHATTGPPASMNDPLGGLTRITMGGGAVGRTPSFELPVNPAIREQDDAKEALLDGLFPDRPAGRRYHPYSLTRSQ